MKPDLEASYVAFVSTRRTTLRRVAYALCGDWNLAEDLVQVACEKLYVAWPRLRRQGEEEAYARRIIMRARIDETRRPWRREHARGLTATAHEGQQPAEPRDRTAESDAREPVVAALQLLPPMQRKVVVLRHLYDLSVAETAHELRISQGTVKSHAARGLAALQQTLGPIDTHPSPR